VLQHAPQPLDVQHVGSKGGGAGVLHPPAAVRAHQAEQRVDPPHARPRQRVVEQSRRESPDHDSVGGGLPLEYGYRYVRKNEAGDARYEIVEEQVLVVRELFRRYVEEHESIGALGRWASNRGLPSVWDRSVIWAILRNPAYCGQAAFGKTQRCEDRPRVNRVLRLKGQRVARRAARRDHPRERWVAIPVPAIISEQTFELAARRLQANRHFAGRRTKEASLLQGLVVCKSCSYSYYRTSTRTKRRKLYYYRCLGSDDYRFEHG
jgi:site-specific DNA recombinase